MATIITPDVNVEYVLNQFILRSEKLIDLAKQTSTDVSQIGGCTLRRTLQFAQVVYSNKLKETIQNVDSVITKVLQQMEAMILKAENEPAMRSHTLAKQAQALSNNLPLSDIHHPQLVQTSPCTFFRSGSNPKDIFFSFMGNFADALKPGYKPSLDFNGQTIEPAMYSTTDLLFQAPFTTLFPNNAVNSMVYCDGTLTLPWTKEDATSHKATFKVLIGALPPSPGPFTFVYFEELERELPFGYDHPHFGGGHFFKREGFITGPGVVYRTLKWGETHAIGSNKTVTCSIQCGGLVLTPQIETITLTWGKSYFLWDVRMRKPERYNWDNNWFIAFNPFDGNNQALEYKSAFIHRYLTCEQVIGGYRLTATLPEMTDS